MSAVPPSDDRPEGDEPVELLALDADEHNPELTTRREAFELELDEHGRSEEGEDVEITDVVDEAAEAADVDEDR